MSSDLTRFDGDIPDHYDRGLGPNIFVDYGTDLANRVGTHRPQRVLELAAGTGIVTRLLRDALPADSELVATDLSDEMLAVARRKFGEGERVVFRQADATQLPFADRSFDLAVCQFGVMFFPDKESAYRDALRVLKPGGRYLFNVWSSFEHNPFARIAHETTARFFDEDPPEFYRLPFSYHDADRISAAMSAAGFREVRAEVLRLDRTVEDYDEFARGLVFGNPIAEEVRSRGSVDPETVRAAIASALREEFGDEPSPMPLQAVVLGGVRP